MTPGVLSTELVTGTELRFVDGWVELSHSVMVRRVRLSVAEFSAFLHGREPVTSKVQAALAEAGLLAAGSVVPDAALAWMNNGWRRNLDYFQWSENEEKEPASEFLTAPRTVPDESQPDPASESAGTGTIALPDPAGLATAPLDQILIKRRTKRRFSGRQMPLESLSALIQADTGWQAGPGFQFYVIGYDVARLAAGVYRVIDSGKSLSPVNPGLYREEVREIICGMPAPRTAAATIALVADFDRWMRARPYERGLRELYIELGRVAQRLTVVAEALGLGSMITPATNDERLARLLRLPSLERAPVDTLTIGFPPGGAVGDGRIAEPYASSR